MPVDDPGQPKPSWLRRLGRLATVGIFAGAVPLQLALRGADIHPIAADVSVIGAAAVLLLMLEWWLPRGGLGERPPGTLRLDAAYNVISGALNVVLPALVLIEAGQLLAARVGMPQAWPQDLPFWLDVVLCILLIDFVSYWWHRLEHSPRFPFFWRIHAVHHTPRYFDFFMGGHVHPLDVIIFAVITAGFAAFVGVPSETIASAMLFGAIVGGGHHLNAETDCGWLNRLFPFADHHTVHHARAPHENGNFGNITTIFDQLFGTWLPPRPFADQETGAWSIVEDYPHADLWFQLRTPFGRTWRKAKGELPMNTPVAPGVEQASAPARD